MAEQILSQEEIDALLSAMDKGEVQVEESKTEEVEVESYDLTSQCIMLRDQFYALEEVYDKFTRLLHNSVSSSLQRSIEVEFVSTEMVKFGEFKQSFSNPTGFNFFNMEPLIGSALLAVEPNLAFSLIECMFGGNGRPLSQVREFTLIELRMVRKFAVQVLEDLEKAWALVYPVKIDLKKTETKPEFVHLVAPNELVIVVVFSLTGEEFTGNIHLCISYLTLEPIKAKLSSKSLSREESENTWRPRIQAILEEAQAGITAELGRTTTATVRDLLELQAGDVVNLNTGPQDPVTVMIESIPKYNGFPGVVKGNRAVQIRELFCRNGGSYNNGCSR